MTVIAYFLGQARSSFNMLRFSVRAIVEGNDSFDRIKDDTSENYRATNVTPFLLLVHPNNRSVISLLAISTLLLMARMAKS
ncbi:hypothetical protein E2C01_045698 [Portunus trituberculatus]|uniref:Uncharacterized protein n=1 Tax=Portunus trituberculatus TaxID=210409 RepID=A0A5B7G5Q5_PORTR|nr:hypothetical protein [Portunus trituberculatus]